MLTVDGHPAVSAIVIADADPRPGETSLSLLGGPVSAPAGATASDLVEAQLTDTAGLPLGDVLVAWGASDGGSLLAETPRTDSTGRARARWTLGPRAGRQRGWAQIGSGRTARRLPVDVMALPGAPASVRLTRAGGRAGEAGGPAQPAVELRVLDRGGNAVPGARVTVHATGGVAPASLITDSVGRVLVDWTLGTVAGRQRLSVEAAGVADPAEVVATVAAAAPARISLLSLPAAAPPGRPLARPIDALVADRFGNPVAGAMVTFTAGAGKVTPSRVRTGSNGHATARWVLGARPGSQRLDAAVAGVPTRASAAIRAVR
jgi:hypothetical protein